MKKQLVGLALAAVIVSVLAAVLVTTTGLKEHRETLRTEASVQMQLDTQQEVL